MNQPRTRIFAAACTVAALAAPTAAQAKPGHGRGHGHAHAHAAPVARGHHGAKHQRVRGANVIAGGTVTSVDGSVVTFTVEHGNHAARAFKGQPLQADVSDARIRVKDVNGDGKRDLADVAAGDRVQVQLRIPRHSTDLSQPFAARRLRDFGAPAATGDSADGDSTDGDSADGTESNV